MRPNFKPFALMVIALAFEHSTVLAQTQVKDNLNVAIFLYEGVELLDFAGPGEVFSATNGFRVYTVTLDGQEIVSQRFVRIKPEYSMETAPLPDIIVFPGGGSGPTSENPQVMKWIKGRAQAGAFFMSVCTGASILGNAGLLKNLNITTWYGFIPHLQKMLPDSKVLEHTRFVDNGNVITTAGVSAGIDGALHLVSRIKGLDVAKATAKYMEYDKWNPDDGRVDYKNEYIEQLVSNTTTSGPDEKYANAPAGTSKALPYAGELKNVAAGLKEKGMYNEAARVLEALIKLYPNEGAAYTELASVNRKIGRPAPTAEDEYIRLLTAGKVQDALTLYEKDQRSFPGWKFFSEQRVNDLGYEFMQKNDYPVALAIFQLNVKAFPDSANAFDSLGEACMKAGNKKEAVTNYRKSIALDPSNENGKKMLAQLGEKI
jgi:putative intracellular protease/amidase/TolA-binding protein